MKYRKLGRTGLQVSEIGFGCGNVGGLMVRGTHKDQVEAVELALSHGINYFDTAPSYGDGKSETNLGKVLAELNPDIILASKVRISVEKLDNIRNSVEESLENTLNRLQRDNIDILQLHSRIASSRHSKDWPRALSLEDVLGENGVADSFDQMRRKGKVRFIGITGLGETRALHKVVESKRFDLVQAYFNILNPSAGYHLPSSFTGYNFQNLIDKANEYKLGVAAIRVMAAGALGGEESRKGYAASEVRGPIVQGGEYKKDKKRGSKLDFLTKGGLSLPQVALKFVLMHSGVSTALVGFSNFAQIREAVEMTKLEQIPEKHLAKLQNLWSQKTW
jgi:L-galactose dehydrogenase/L-glyceraldehyde 3-phosphate reductase